MIDAANDGTIGDNAYRTIRRDIIFGQLRPSEKLRLEPLRKRYHVSVTTLREILNRLTSDGLVVAEGQKGFEVASVSEADLREVAELRLLVEGHAVTRSFENGDLDWESQVVAAHHKLRRFEDRMIAGDRSARDDWKRADWGFHRALIAGCDSRTLLDLHGQIFDKYIRYQILTSAFRGERGAREHAELLEVAFARDANKAREILSVHILGGVEFIIKARNDAGSVPWVNQYSEV
ncbi:FCD domain-containing protein [Hoeflea sp. YIM 152468]|uniref:GntR family transcriptional regulator n=1 Tax=Hoeflea sp. YIM 152468 TaxID=3031759 RepID=UPI0023DCD02A|nr:FCD domain-containing protein [Hoeflea sp. YIM 152468]MDF1610322.1 FCD domain-containing protein [Hoeflea sp. YIM 152468]